MFNPYNKNEEIPKILRKHRKKKCSYCKKELKRNEDYINGYHKNHFINIDSKKLEKIFKDCNKE